MRHLRAACCSTVLSEKQTASIRKHFLLWRGLQLSQFSLWIVLPKCSLNCLICSFLSLSTLFLGFLLSPCVSPPFLKHLNPRHITYCNWEQLIPLLCRAGKGPSWDLPGSQRWGWDSEPTPQNPSCSGEIKTRHLNPGETVNISSTNKWGKLWGRSSSSSPSSLHRGLASSPPGSKEGLTC